MVLYEDVIYRVEQGWFSGWRVTYHGTGARFTAPRDLSTPLGLNWHKIRRNKDFPKPLRDAAERWMFRLFAEACADPTSEAADLFRSLSPDEFANRAIVSVTLLAAEQAAFIWFIEAAATSKRIYDGHRFEVYQRPDGSWIAGDKDLRRFGEATQLETAFFIDMVKRTGLLNHNSMIDRETCVAAAYRLSARMITDKSVTEELLQIGPITIVDDLRTGRLNHLIGR